MHIETYGLLTHQEQELAKRAEAFRYENRNAAETGPQCDSGMAHELLRDRIGDAEKTQAIDPRRAGSSRSFLVEEITLENVDEVMRYQPWMSDQVAAGDVVRETLIAAVRAILRHVPRCPNRTKAINHLIDARMDANAAISFRGRF